MFRKGFSLVEVMVALGVTAAIAMVVMKVSEQGSKSAKQTQSKMEITQTQAEIISMLSNRAACTYTMGGAGSDISDLVSGGTRDLTIIKSQNNNNFIGPIPTQRNNIQIEKFFLAGWDNVDKMANASVNYTYRLGHTNTVSRSFNFKISFDVDSTQPTLMNGCVARAAQTSIDPKEICYTVVGLDATGAAYWDGSQCEFARASCEKIGRTWNAMTSVCEISDEEKLSIKKIECDTRKGVFVKGTQMWHWGFSGAMTYNECTANDIKTNKQCFCKTEFRRNYSLAPDAPTEAGGAGGQMKKILLNGWRFNVASKVFTIPRLIPNRPTGVRYTKISMRIGIENLSGANQWYTAGIGCYAPAQSLYTDTTWIPSNSSSDYYTTYGSSSGPGFLVWMGFSSGGNNYDALETLDDSGTILIPPIGSSIREQSLSITQRRPLAPGDKCVMVVYTHNNNHEVRLGGVSIQLTQYTDESQFSYDQEQ
jgi:prepilin-type N-terminal cleavage/methylation domain-containing protein